MSPAAPVPALNNPLQSSTTSFTLGTQSTFQVFGTNFSSTNVTSVDPSSSTAGISWTFPPNNFSVVNSTTISVTGTPSQAQGPPGSGLGNLTVIINKNTTTQSSASANNISYNAVVAQY